MKTITDLSVDGKRVLIRVDFNVPLDAHQNITDDTRIRGVLPTLSYVLEHNAKVIICSHLGRPKGKVVPEMSLGPVAKRLGELTRRDVKMAPGCIGRGVETMVSAMTDGDIVLLENLRYHPEETANDDAFGKALASLCDIYINDAFAVSHRVNASVAAVTKYAPICGMGLLLQKELEYFRKAMTEPRRPLVAIVGGAKVSSKLGALKNMIHHVDKIIVGGAMANTFLKRLGHSVGKSMIEEDLVEVAGEVIDACAQRGIKFYLPVDAVIAREVDSKAAVKIVTIQEIPADWMALDIGPATSRLYAEALYDAKTIIWNGPMGVFELDSFSRGTTAMVAAVADSHALSIVGGGDTDVAVHQAGEAGRIGYISTGGGAFLSLLEGKTLPAITALEDHESRIES